MKLIKINTDHYIIVDDSEIKEGDYSFYPPFGIGINIVIDEELCFYIEPKDGRGSFTQRTYQTLDRNKKITHSTQPLEFGWAQEGRDIVSKKVYDKVQSLSLSEVKELLGEVDVEQYAWDNPVLSRKDVYELFNEVFKDKHIEGAYRISASKQVYQFNAKLRELAKQKALEDNKDKKYTEEDIRLTFGEGVDAQFMTSGIHTYEQREQYRKMRLNMFIQSLQPKTEWEVEYDENGKLKLV